LKLGTGARESKNENDRAIGPKKKFNDIFSRADTMHQRDRQTNGQTDGQTDGHRATAETILRIASRGNKNW